jgi:phosphate transport system substrate-binding protein
VFPLLTKLARKWVKTPQGSKFGFRVLQGGSNVGINDASRGRVSMGMASRDVLPTDPGGLVFTRIARDAICIVTHPSNPVNNISRQTLQQLYAGGSPPGGVITHWANVPGSPRSDTVVLYGRNNTSGTFDAFNGIFMAPLSQKTYPGQVASNGLVAQGVKGDPQGIGYVSFAFTGGLNAIPYNGVACTLRNAKSGSYTGVRSFNVVTKGAPIGGVKKFLKWIKKDKKADKIVSSECVPV